MKGKCICMYNTAKGLMYSHCIIFSKIEEEERGKIHDTSRWISFVANNLLAYTAVFQQLLPRFMRTDLVAPKNATMLYRVTKVCTLIWVYYSLLVYCSNIYIRVYPIFSTGIFASAFSKNDMWSRELYRRCGLKQRSTNYQSMDIGRSATDSRIRRADLSICTYVFFSHHFTSIFLNSFILCILFYSYDNSYLDLCPRSYGFWALLNRRIWRRPVWLKL